MKKKTAITMEPKDAEGRHCSHVTGEIVIVANFGDMSFSL